MAVHAVVVEPTFHVTCKPLRAIQQIRRLRGGAQAQLMRASDGEYYVVKFRDNPQHLRVLANEFFASRLGQRLGLPLPEVAVIELCDWLIQNTPDLRIESCGITRPVSSGLHLASRYTADIETGFVFDYLPAELFPRVINRFDLARALVLDKWTCNADGRQAVFTRLALNAGYEVSLIDQGYCFNAGEWRFEDLPLRGVYYRNFVYQHVSYWDNFEPALSTAEEMDESDLWECAAGIPTEWCGDDSAALPRLVEGLYRRRSKIRDLITSFRTSSRDPFPNWVGK